MKRFLCILMCLMLAAPAALAIETTTPTKKFRQQFITGGNGLRGTVSLSVSGAADWVEVLLPFTATKLQLRAIGEKQGDMSAVVSDDDDWQVKLYANDAQSNPRATTYIYGGPEAIYAQSELLPDVLLTLPVKNVHLPYQLVDGEMFSMLNSFDPLGLMNSHDGGNTQAYSAITQLMQIDDADWEANWEPVLSKYYTELDMWLSAYGTAPVVSGSTGSLTMNASYSIPAEDLKAEAKYIIGLMIYDTELQNLLLPYVTAEQRALYLNPSLVYFYEYCIDAAPLNGTIQLNREMTAKGETIGMSVSLPLPGMPEELTQPIGEMIAEIFSLPYTDILSDLTSISFGQSGGDVSVSVSSPKRTISFIIDENASNAETVHWEGFVRITPAVGNDEPPLSAAFTYKTSHRIWEDEEYAIHEDFSYLLSAEPDLSLMDEDDPFRSTYVDFPALSLEAGFNYLLQTDRANRPVQLEMTLNAQLPDAKLGLTANLRTAERWEHELLPMTGAENLLAMSDARVEELLKLLTTNAIQTMSTLNADTAIVALEPVATPEPASAPTAVPPVQ